MFEIRRFDNISSGHGLQKNGFTKIDDDHPPCCRFCGKKYDKSSFSNLSHAVPELIKNNEIALEYECNDCNKYFCRLEVELAKFLNIDPVLAKHIPADREQLEHIVDNPQNKPHSIINSGSRNTQFICSNDEKIIKIDNNYIEMNNNVKSHNKIMVYKSILKMALSIMPYEYLKNFSTMKRFLMDSSHNPYYILNIYNCIEIIDSAKSSSLLAINKCTFLEERINEHTTISLQGTNAFGKNRIFNFYFYLGTSAYQIAIPSDQFLRECYLTRNTIPVKDNTLFLHPSKINKNTVKYKTEVVFCNSKEKVKNHKEKWVFSFFLKIPTTLNNTRITNKIPEEKNIEVDWDTIYLIIEKNNGNFTAMKYHFFITFYYSIKHYLYFLNDQAIVYFFEQFIYDFGLQNDERLERFLIKAKLIKRINYPYCGY
ncbi:hypothetical protein KWH75_06405 [Morganella morganii]|uniref:hypothetical protein n=1 Tax=Morganella morganii TaxID=582 RepID=UPI0021CEA438|nr:hypothetical protein [Morganella morganii]MCU6236698.1 hypothetical protein [Morganella morganii]